MASKGQITKRLADAGMAWATRSDKYTDPSDPFGAQQRGEKTYHVHPDRNRPEVTAIKRFRTLAEIDGYLDAVENALAAYKRGEYIVADRIMDDYWASVAY